MPTSLRLRLTLPLMPIALAAPPAAAQAGAPPADRWQLTLNDHEYIWDVRLVKLAGDTLIVRNRDSLISAPVARIAEMRLLPETILMVGDGHRSAIRRNGRSQSQCLRARPA
jgi:hypothetical protein